MVDFYLGDCITWITEKETGIIIDLLDYEGEEAGIVGIILDETKKFELIKACDCELYSPPDPLEELDEWLAAGNVGFPRSDYY